MHHLGRDAFAHHLKKTAAAGANVGSIAVYKGRVLLSIDGDGLFYEDLSKYASTATLISSTADWGNAGEKAWDTINIAHKALPSGGSVAVQYAMSLPEGATWKDGLLSTTTDSTYKEGRLSKATSRHFCVKIVSTAPAGEATAPTILSFGVRSNPAVSGNPEYTLTRYVRLLAIDRRNKQAPQIWQDVHAMREWLQGLAYEWVVVQEPGATWIARVSGVADVHPERPNFVATAGETSRDYYVVSLSLRGTR